MKKIKDWFKKHEKLWNTIVSTLLIIWIFLAGVIIGLDMAKRNSTASAEEYAPSEPYEFHYRLPIYFSNIVGFRPSDGDVSLPIQSNFYTSQFDDVLPFTTEISYPDHYYQLTQSFYYQGFEDDYQRYKTTIGLSSISGNSFMLVAEDFWFSPEYDFEFYLNQYGQNPVFNARYVVNYKDLDWREKAVVFENNSSSHDIASLIDDNVNDTSQVFYIRRLEVLVQNVGISYIQLIFDFNGIENDYYVDIVGSGIRSSNATTVVSRIDWVGSTVDSINSILSIQIIPSFTTDGGLEIPAFTLGNVLAFVIIVPLIIAVLRLWLGG